MTLWPDGIVRFDGRTGPRQGAWEGAVDPKWFARIAGLARDIDPGKITSSDSTVTLVVETTKERVIFEAGHLHEPESFWLLSTSIDGLAQRVFWTPLDVTGGEDFAKWGTGIALWMGVGSALASALAADGSLVVLAGAQANTATSPSLEDAYKGMRTRLIDERSVTLEDDHFRLTRHIHFTSPSAAASVLVGSNTSGRRVWRNSSGRPWSELELD